MSCIDIPSHLLQSRLNSRIFWDKPIEIAIHKCTFEKFVDDPNFKFSSLCEEVILWGTHFSPLILDGMSYYLDNKDYFFRCIGELIKHRGAVDPDWFFVVSHESPNDLNELKNYIGSIQAYGYEFPGGGMTWQEWLDYNRQNPHSLVGKIDRLNWNSGGKSIRKNSIDFGVHLSKLYEKDGNGN